MARKVGAQPGHAVSEETRAKIRAALTGRKLVGPSKNLGRSPSPETRAKLAAALRRWDPICSIDGCDNPTSSHGWCSTHDRRYRLYGDVEYVKPKRGAANSNWKGDDVGYDAAHWRLRKSLPRICKACGTTEGRLEIALLRTAPEGHIKEDRRHGPYSTEPGDYVRLCVTCHRRYDSPRTDTRALIEAALANADS